MTKRISYSYAILACALFACSEAATPSRGPTTSTPQHGPRARVTTLALTIETEDVSAKSESLRSLVSREHGYIQNATVAREAATFDLGVPADRVESFRRAVRRLGDVTMETETAVLEIEERQRIEPIDAERATFPARVDYATVNVSLALPHVPFWREPTASIGAAASFGFDVFCAIAVSGIALIAAVAPTLFMIAFVIGAMIALIRSATRRARA